MPRYDDIGPTMPTPAEADAMPNRKDPMRRDLLILRALCIALLVLSLVLVGVVWRLSSRVEATERAVDALPGIVSQAADEKLAQLAPQLEQRLGRFEEMSNRVEQRIGAAETTVVERMRIEAPKVLDAYADQKIAQIERAAEKIEKNLSKK
jgi:hypothetical protein